MVTASGDRWRHGLWDLAEGYAKAHEMNAVGGRHHETVRRSRELDIVIPAASVKHFEFASRRPRGILKVRVRKRFKPIGTPLPYIAMHIMQSPWVRTFLADWMGSRPAIFS